MRGNRIRCANCGAEIARSSAKCPHCNAINEWGAQKEYIHHLEGIKKDLGQLPEVLQKAYRGQLARIWKRVLCIIAAAAVAAGAAIGICRMAARRAQEADAPDTKAQLLWEKEHFGQLDEWYAQGDYDAIVSFMQSRYEDEGYCVWNWEHYPFIYVYESYLYFLDTVDCMSDKKTANRHTAMTMASTAMRLLFFLQEQDYAQEEWETIQELQTDIEAVVYGPMKFTEEEALALYEKINDGGYIDYEACDAYTDGIWERFMQ